MKFDYRLLKAMRAYEKEVQEGGKCLSYNGEVPKSHEKYIIRIQRWATKVAALK